MVESGKRRRFFPDAFKLEAVTAVRGGQSVSAVASEMGLPDRLVRAWLGAQNGRERRAGADARRSAGGAHAFPVAPNLLGRDFTATASDRVWLGDITYLWTAEGWLYLAAVLDPFSRPAADRAKRDSARLRRIQRRSAPLRRIHPRHPLCPKPATGVPWTA